MLVVDKKTLPRRLTKDNIHDVVGESVRWFCPACRKWRTNKIKSGGNVTCSVCGGAPDWEKRWPVLSFRDRLKQVNALCAEGSSWREEYDRVTAQYGAFIDETWRGIPKSAKVAGWKYFQNCWETIDGVANYLLGAADAPATDLPYAYNQQGLQRRYFDPERAHNVVSLGDLNLTRTVDDGNVRRSGEEVAESLSFRSGYSIPHYDEYFSGDIFKPIVDPLERAIAVDLYRGFKKKEIEKKYQLTERRVRTVISHIVKSLKNM